MTMDLDFVLPAELTGYVREVPTPANYLLNQVLPDEDIQDIEAAWDVLTQTNRTAMFRAWDTETPIGTRDSFQRSKLTLPPIGQKTPIGEYDRLLLERVRSGGNNRDRMVEAIFNDAAVNTRAVRARVELARGQVLSTGKFTLAENGLTIEADFGVAVNHLPTAQTLWSDHTNAVVLSDLLAWTDVYVNDCGDVPGAMWVSRPVLAHMLRNAEIRTAAATALGTPTVVSPAVLNQVLAANGLPEIREYNTQVSVGGVSTRCIPANKVIMTPQDPATLGSTAWGITAESLELAGGTNPTITFTDAPGLVGVVIKEGDPVKIWTKVTGVVMPMIKDARRLFAATVAA